MLIRRFIIVFALAAYSAGGSLCYAQSAQSGTIATDVTPALDSAPTQISAKTLASDAGVISEMASDLIVLKTESGSVRYVSSSKTLYVDETGSPIAPTLVGEGHAVTVQYARMGDRLLADRVVVRQDASAPIHAATQILPMSAHAVPAPAPDERTTAITEPATVLVTPKTTEKQPPDVREKKAKVDRPVASKKKANSPRPVPVKSTISGPAVNHQNHTATPTPPKRLWKRIFGDDGDKDEDVDEDDD